ncbi:uncharacterized protein LOC128956581 [Oppia nitens]|uniref:uncharacterized protein LOC128956581 n=1 Tax=Oppia nitens TaxID=1686743 RepID=UPI0023DBAB46|nr:uncharacterized protein LOC128956581 [Oppia nitens]
MSGILGLGHNNSEVNEPQIIPELCDKKVQKFIIGIGFALCITLDQQIYSWGWNKYKQLGRHTINDDEGKKPAIITYLSDKCIIDITCDSHYSLALTSAGTVYGWGNNTYGQCGCGQYALCIDSPTRVIFPANTVIKSIYSYNCKSFKNDKFLSISMLETGSFGQVFKVKNKITNNLCAIKQLNINDDNQKHCFENEIKQLVKLQSEFVVKHYHSWIESNNNLYIQMELCSQSLKDLIKLKAEIFKRQSNEPIDCIEYYITSHIMLEMCECVEYLHTRQPPVIHRDLKPGNILINDKPLDNRFIKLCDFGFATDHNRTDTHSDSHTSKAGTKYYTPPERNGRNYNEKFDIYSLGIIGLELFDINLNDVNIYREQLVSKYMTKLIHLLISMTHILPTNRPTSTQIINNLCQQCMFDNRFLLKNTNNFQQIVENLDIHEFYANFFKTKIR